MTPKWRFDERAHAGEEHLDPAFVLNYDEKIPFDPSVEVTHLRDLGLSTTDVVVDFGTGTGSFPVAIAPYCKRVIGVDISRPMLDVAQQKIDDSGLNNVSLVCDGFLNYTHAGEDASFVFSKNALHHLPDFWKVEALKNIASTLQPGGIFRLRDLVYSFDPTESTEAIESWLESMASTSFTEAELHRHFRDEFSTYDFLLEPMLEDTGFEIIDNEHREGFYSAYTCRLIE